MNLLMRLFVCILVLGLSNCVKHHNSLLNSHHTTQCKVTCVKIFEVCKKKCVNNCLTCTKNAFHSSSVQHTKYVKEKIIQGGFIARDLKSYRDPLQCRKISCDCVADIHVCNQGCTPVIQKQLRVVPQCT